MRPSFSRVILASGSVGLTQSAFETACRCGPVELAELVGGRGRDPAILHGNGTKLDDRTTNLRWGTARENAADVSRHGTIRRGEPHGGARFSVADVASIRQDPRPTRQVAQHFGIGDRGVRDS